MSLDFNDLSWDNLEKQLGATKKVKKSYDDPRFWTLAKDENDNGVAVVRLLPDPEGRQMIQRYTHSLRSFDNVNKKYRWYIAISPATINEDCPATQLWSTLYNQGTEEAKKEAKTFSRKVEYIANVKIIKDPANPQNEGKIFLWTFGTKLKDKIAAAMNPSETDIKMGEVKKQVFHPMLGCNLKLKVKKVAGFPNWDDSSVEGISAAYETEDEARKDITENAHLLSELTAPDAFDTYEELKNRLLYVLETYKPEHMDSVTFKSAVTNTLGTREVKGKESQTVQNSGTSQETVSNQKIDIDEPEYKPVSQSVQESRTVSNDLDFLDNL